MSLRARKEYLKAIKERYRNSTKGVKTLILNEFVLVTGCTRKHAIRALKDRPGHTTILRPGRPPKYQGDDFLTHLVAIWNATGKICSKKLAAALPYWLPHYAPLVDNPELKQYLLRISPATIDRVLKPYKGTRKGLSTTQASPIKNQIPIELLTQKVNTPGYVEADTVAHCGDSIAGSYLHSLTLTDLFSGWTENRATWTKQSDGVLRQIRDMERSLPFAIKGFACDNGTEFLNYELWHYFKRNRKNSIQFVRRRPYKKNDNAHVEQKNWTHVRQIFGYERLDYKALEGLMNEIYKEYWNILQNYFIPSFKLKEKTRIGSKIVKKYGPLKTPYQRIIASADISYDMKERMKTIYKSLNPFLLEKKMQEKLNLFFKLVRAQGVSNAA